MALPVNPARLTEVHVRTGLGKIAQAITVLAQAMTIQANRHAFQQENPLSNNMANKLRDFSRINPPIFTVCKTIEDPQEFVEKV